MTFEKSVISKPYRGRIVTEAERFYQQKMAKKNVAVATKALANKMSRASYFIMRDQVPFEEDMLFR